MQEQYYRQEGEKAGDQPTRQRWPLTLKSLALSMSGVGVDGARALADALQACPSVPLEVLEMDSNQAIGDQGVVQVREAEHVTGR